MTTGRSGSVGGKAWPFWLAALLVLWLASPARLTAQPDLDEQARAVAAELRCPVCQNLSVADSSSELARDMREVIRAELRAGKTPEEVKAYFVSKYGEWILLSPRPRGLSLLLWIGPFAGAAAGLAVAIVAVRRWARRAPTADRPAPDPALLARVRREALADDAESGPPDPELLSQPEQERLSLYAALRELDFDHRSGKLSGVDYEAIRAEYEARAVTILGELDRLATAPAPDVPASRVRPVAGRRSPERLTHPWRLAAAAIFLLTFGVSVGYFLTQSVRPRSGERASITGDALTGTGPGGMTVAGRAAVREVSTLLASGRSAYQRQEWPAAIDAFRQVLALEPENPEAHTYLGIVLLHAGHVDEALSAVERALRAHPGFPLARWAKGLVLFDGKQDYAGAIQVWETLMTVNLAAEDADQVARMLTEARRRLAAQGGGPRPRPAPARGSPGT